MKKTNTLGKMLLLAPCAMMCATLASAGEATYTKWLDREISVSDAGKLTLVRDAASDTVRACTTSVGELADGCDVTLTYTAGERFCTLEDVKAGDGETLASCHRLRSSESASKDLIVFLLSHEKGEDAIAILVDSPSRVTEGGIIVGKF